MSFGAMPVFAALLRGINVGGNNRLAMKDLCAMFDAAKCTNVRHYIQSGNVVFETTAAKAKTIASRIEKAIAKHKKLDIRVVVRSKAEIDAVANDNPFLKKAKGNDKALHVGFLTNAPDKKAIAALDPNRSPPDEYLVKGSEIYLFCPNGIGQTKLSTAWLDRQLSTTSTFRNWNTVLELQAMMAE